jgi:hypothetical protein
LHFLPADGFAQQFRGVGQLELLFDPGFERLELGREGASIERRLPLL